MKELYNGLYENTYELMNLIKILENLTHLILQNIYFI
jgi:hypothetical protein